MNIQLTIKKVKSHNLKMI